MRRRPITLLMLAGMMAVATVPGPAGAQGDPVKPYRSGDAGVTALNILPPGQGRYLNSAELLMFEAAGTQPASNTDQYDMYDSLVQGAPDITPQELTRYFKDASFGVKEEDVVSRYEPRDGVVVVRDTFGVPHVYGATRSDVFFGAGYVTAEDRLFMIDVLRHTGRGRLSEFLGASPANLAMDRASYANAGYSEPELQAMYDRLPGVHPTLGTQVQQDVLDFAGGINQFIDEAIVDPRKLPAEYHALQLVPAEWTVTDTVAEAALIGSALGVGGGGELGNAAFLAALQAEGKSRAEARAILADLRLANDPEARVTAVQRFPYNEDLGPVDPKSVAVPDGAVEIARSVARRTRFPAAIDGPFGPIPLRFPSGASNALLVTSARSRTGRALAVMGPQVAYWSPEILMEMELQGPSISSRGVGFPGISMYTLLGRGRDYAWSATSASGDQVDVFAERLCNPGGGAVEIDSTFYMSRGKCVEMYERTDSWFAKPSAGGMPSSPSQESILVEFTTQRSDNGIVQARGTVGGVPVAFVSQRSTFGAEVDSALTYVEIMNPAKIRGPADFQRAFARYNFTFNWFYVDPKHISFLLGGNHPLRARGVDPDLPVWGTGKWEWRGKLPFQKTPKTTDPRRGYIVSWNNKQAPGFRAADNNWGFGTADRSALLEDRIRVRLRAGKVGLTDLVNIMGDAATVDLRGYAVLPYMLRVIGKPKDPKVKEAVTLMRGWVRAGAHRRDLDEDGNYDHQAAVALMDAWWEPALEAVFRPALGAAYDVLPYTLHDSPAKGQGSAFNDGLYSHMQKDLRRVLGLRVPGAFSHRYCGRGKLAGCRAALLESLTQTVAALEEQFGGGPQTWDFDESIDDIRYSSVGVVGQDPMQWQNRPTFQQVIEFRATR